MNDDFLYEAYEKAGTREVWRMRDGTEIKMSEMDTRHIINCIKMLERKYKEEYGDKWHENATTIEICDLTINLLRMHEQGKIVLPYEDLAQRLFLLIPNDNFALIDQIDRLANVKTGAKEIRVKKNANYRI